MIADVDQYLFDGCMRCKYGATPKCKVNNWRIELGHLRQIALQTGLKEEKKWGGGGGLYTKREKYYFNRSAQGICNPWVF